MTPYEMIGTDQYIEMIDELVFNKMNEAFNMNKSKAHEIGAYEGLNKIIADVSNNKEQFMKATKYMHENFYKKINELVELYGYVDESIHFMRNILNKAPKTLEKLLKINKGLQVIDKWRLLQPYKSIYNMYGEDGEYNLKFVSANGFFEAVYNKNGDLLTEENDPINMGTYNYADYETTPVKHGLYDIWPYFIWGNVKGYKKPDDDEWHNLDRFNNNSEAIKRYEKILSVLEE